MRSRYVARPTSCATASRCSATPAWGRSSSPRCPGPSRTACDSCSSWPSWRGDAPARPRRAPGPAGRRGRDRRARRRVRRELPRVDAARLGAAPARRRARPLARPHRRRLVVDADRRGAGRSRGRARLLHAGGRPAHAAGAARPARARPARAGWQRADGRAGPRPRARVRGLHPPGTLARGDRRRHAGARRGGDARGGLPHGPAVDAAGGARTPLLRGGGLAHRRARAVAGRARAADRRLRQVAVRVYVGAFGDAGHAFPMLALGEALVARGHAVALQTWRRWEEHAVAAGMTFAAAPEYPVFPTREQPLAPYAAAVRAARETVPSVRDAAPDVVVADILTVATALT